jgi:undecaprenyl diphosphate synthase
MENIPIHVAIIMDGNRRWAAKQGLGAVSGHERAAKQAIEPLVERAAKLGIKYLTFWAFSTENWKRDKQEIEGLFKIFREVLCDKVDRLNEKGVKVRYIGDIEKFPEDICQKVKDGIEKTKNNTVITVSFALNYGGRDEIIRAMKKAIASGIRAENLNEETFSTFLDTAGVPDPDLIIRTGGQLRLSGYLPWQGVYAELYFTPILFPDFLPEELDKAIEEYQNRTRRFGGGKFKDYKVGKRNT